MAFKSSRGLALCVLIICLGILDPKWPPRPAEFGSRMLGIFPLFRVLSGMVWPQALSGMSQGARLPFLTNSSPPEHCLGALPNLNFYLCDCPSQVRLGLGDTKQSDASDPQSTPASCQEALRPAIPWPRLKGVKGLLCVPAVPLLNGKHRRAVEWCWYHVHSNLSSTIYELSSEKQTSKPLFLSFPTYSVMITVELSPGIMRATTCNTELAYKNVITEDFIIIKCKI